MTVARLQAISGICFAIFLILHLATTTSAVAGPATYDSILEGTRHVYRPHIVVELLLIVVAGAFSIIWNSPSADRSRFVENRTVYERFLPFMMGARKVD